MDEITNIIQNLLQTIAQNQASNGSFDSLASADTQTWQPAHIRHTTFTTSLILNALAPLKGAYSEPAAIGEKGVAFLQNQINEFQSVNYWDRYSKEYKALRYPDDLDDTFCAHAAIAEYSGNDPGEDGERFAGIVKLLTWLEEDEGGPYRTWIVEDQHGAWHDVDPVVNSNIGFFLSLHDIELAGLQKYIDAVIDEQAFQSKYYSSPIVILYFISRFSKTKKEQLIGSIVERRNDDDIWETPLETAMAVSSLIRLGYAKDELRPAIASLMQASADGIPLFPFYLENKTGDTTEYNTSPALMASYVAEALFLFDSASSSASADVHSQNLFLPALLAKIKDRFAKLNSPLQEAALAYVEAQQNLKDLPIVIKLVQAFHQALQERYRLHSNESTIEKLCLASAYGILAYRIYDDILDEQKGLGLLPLAALCQREMTELFLNLLPKDQQGVFRDVMDEMDSGIYWEYAQSRAGLPDYGDYEVLAQKSLGLVLAPLTLLLREGLYITSTSVRHFLTAFIHYSIARQLNDDAHDLFDDLSMGIANSIAVLTIELWQKENGRDFAYESDKDSLQAFFWESGIEIAAGLIKNHIAAARQGLAAGELFADPSFLEALLAPLEQAAESAITERDRTLSFLQNYGST